MFIDELHLNTTAIHHHYHHQYHHNKLLDQLAWTGYRNLEDTPVQSPFLTQQISLSEAGNTSEKSELGEKEGKTRKDECTISYAIL